jgi:hypothetical protein
MMLNCLLGYSSMEIKNRNPTNRAHATHNRCLALPIRIPLLSSIVNDKTYCEANH